MDLSNLSPARGSVKNRKRIGRGQGSGRGGTSTKGHKGQKARSGYSTNVGFEGGQQPLQRRVPKYGFRNVNRKEYRGINLDTLQGLADAKKIKEINIETLINCGLASKNDLVKILGRGELKAKLEVKAHAFSKSAKNALEAKGGKAIIEQSNNRTFEHSNKRKPEASSKQPATRSQKPEARNKQP